MKKPYLIALIVIGIAALGAGAAYMHQRQLEQDIADKGSIQILVQQFGASIQKVSLSSPDALQQIANTYVAYATPELVKEWQENKSFAPGKGVSGPWPDRIEVTSITKNNSSYYTIEGNVIEVSGKEAARGGIAGEYPVTMVATRVSGQWLIDEFHAGPEKVFANSTTTVPTAAGTPAATTTKSRR